MLYVIRDREDRMVDERSGTADEALRLMEALLTQNQFKYRAPFTCLKREETPLFRVKRDGGYETI